MNIAETAFRIISAIIALPIYLFLLWYGGNHYIPVLIVSAVVSLLCLYEFYGISSNAGEGKPFIRTGLLAGFAVNILVYLYAFESVMPTNSLITNFDSRWFFALLIAVFGIIMTLQIFTRPLKGGIFSLAVTLFGVIYIVLSFSHIMLIRSLTNGFYYILMLHVIVMLNDSFAYFGGVLFGRHKTGLLVSPNKSWEGYFSGILFGMIASLVANEFFRAFYNVELFGVFEAAIVGLVFSVIGDIGDLIESAIKRDGKVKDSGRLIPGHGGMWDVFDALILSLPLFYYYLKIKGVQ